jgi:hypothetical protein
MPTSLLSAARLFRTLAPLSADLTLKLISPVAAMAEPTGEGLDALHASTCGHASSGVTNPGRRLPSPIPPAVRRPASSPTGPTCLPGRSCRRLPGQHPEPALLRPRIVRAISRDSAEFIGELEHRQLNAVRLGRGLSAHVLARTQVRVRCAGPLRRLALHMHAGRHLVFLAPNSIRPVHLRGCRFRVSTFSESE